MIKLGIIIPNYNKGAYIGELLDSLEPQITDEVQVILIDDASTDNSREVIHNHPILPKITYIEHEKNRWCSATRNTGLEYIRCNDIDKPWYCFIDSDDYVEPNFVETLLGYINNNNDKFDIYVYRFNTVNCDTKEKLKVAFTNTESPFEGDDAIVNDDQLAIYTRLFSYKCFSDFNMNNLYRIRHCGEDYEYTVKTARERRLKYTEDRIYNYRFNVKMGQSRLSGGLDREENE